MASFDRVVRHLEKQYPIGATVEALVTAAPEEHDNVVNTFQKGEIVDLEFIRDVYNMNTVSAVLLHMWHKDGYPFVGQQ